MRSYRSLMAAVAIATCWLGTLATPLRAQDQAVAVVSIAPLDKLLQNISYLTRAVGVPEFGGIANMMTRQYTQGLDGSRPAGVMVQMVDNQPLPLAFLPIKDREQFFSALAGAGIIPDELGDDLFSFDAGGRSIFVKDAGGWLYISQQEEDLENLPADPSTQLGDLPARYDLAVRLNVQAFPEDLRQLAIDQMRTGFERSLAEQSGQSADERAAAEEMGRASVEQLEQLIRETDRVLIGWTNDPKQQRIAIDVAAQFIEGGEFARQTALMENVTSNFTGLLIPGAALTTRFTSLIADKDKALTKNNLKTLTSQIDKRIDDEGGLPTNAKEALKKFSRGVMQVVGATIEGGKLDGGAAVSLSDAKLQAVVGGGVADGRALEREVKALVDSLNLHSNVQLAYDTYKGVTLHRANIPVNSNDPVIARVFGNEVRVVIGTADKAFFLALAPDGDAILKQAIDRVGSTQNVKVNPAELIAEVGQIIQYAQTLSPNPAMDVALQTIRDYDGKDTIRVTSSVIPRGGVYQLSIDEGVLKAIGATARAGQGGGRGF
jgi:hypothetical protein